MGIHTTMLGIENIGPQKDVASHTGRFIGVEPAAQAYRPQTVDVQLPTAHRKSVESPGSVSAQAIKLIENVPDIPGIIPIRDQRIREITFPWVRFVAFSGEKKAPIETVDIFIAHAPHLHIAKEVTSFTEDALTPIASGFVDFNLPSGISVSFLPPIPVVSSWDNVRLGLKKLGLKDGPQVREPVLEAFRTALSTHENRIAIEDTSFKYSES